MGQTTLAESRSLWAETIKGKGGHCPCCDRWGKIYPRHFNSTMAHSLIWLARHQQQNNEENNVWCDVPNTAPQEVTRTNQLPTTRWWGLTERKPSNDGKTKHTGWWRVTEKGMSFATGMIRIPKVAFTYAGEILYFGDDLIHIKDAFETPFDYEQVMLPLSKPKAHKFYSIYDLLDREKEHGRS